MNLLLKEYLSSGDCEEAVRCLRELEVPHFHHELVYEAVVLVLEDAREETASMICALLSYMAVTMIITRDQLSTVGYNKLCSTLHYYIIIIYATLRYALRSLCHTMQNKIVILSSVLC